MKDINVKAIKPQFTTVITTLNSYEDDLIVDGMVKAPRGTVKLYQTVVAVGDAVRNIKVGDLVLVNFNRYIVPKYKENSIKNEISSMEQELVLNIPRIVLNNEMYAKLQDNDIEGVITEFEEYESEQANTVLQ